jgi:hypothetical protein
MNPKWKKGNVMKNLLQLPTNEVIPKCMQSLTKLYHVDDIAYDTDNFVFYRSKSPILLQAHVDTVRDEKKELKIFGNKILYANGILGADDRAGIYAILKIVEQCKVLGVLPNVLLTNYEETGGKGMSAFCKKVKAKELKHINLCIALDRQGVGEYVTYNDLPAEVDNYMQWFGFIESEGTFSDCQIFCKKFKIPSVNVSVGYHHQHTVSECLHMDELNLTINRLIDVIVSPISTRYKTTGDPKWELDYGNAWGSRNWGSNYKWDNKSKKWENNSLVGDYCEFCGEKVDKIYYNYDSQMYICDKCYEYVNGSLYQKGARG